MTKNIAIIPGDGIGPEIIIQAVNVLRAVEKKYGHTFNLEYYLLGGCAIDEFATPLPECTVAAAKAADAVLLGAVGGPKWTHPDLRPEQ